MILYHGTNNINISPIIGGKMAKDTWLTSVKYHAFRVAERRSFQRGGAALVLEIETNNVKRVEGIDTPTYQFNGGYYKVLAMHYMKRIEI